MARHQEHFAPIGILMLKSSEHVLSDQIGSSMMLVACRLEQVLKVDIDGITFIDCYVAFERDWPRAERVIDERSRNYNLS